MKAILWDMDGSLIDTKSLRETAVYDLSEFVGRRLTPELRMQCVSNMLWNTPSIYVDHAGRTLDDELFSSGFQLVGNRFTELVLEHGVEWCPGVPEILDQTRAADIPVVLVTNTYRHVAQPCIDTMGEHHFAAVVCSDGVANRKPTPDPYLRGTELAGFAPEDCLVIEDSSTGMCSILAAGCTMVWSPMPDTSVSQADVETLVSPTRFISDDLDTSNLSLLRAAFIGGQTTWNNRPGGEL